MQGWISLHRSIKKHWLYDTNEPYSKFQAWVDILIEVNHSEQKVLIGEKLILCSRGQSLNSIGTWAKRWNWSQPRVRRFFELLKSDSMIVSESVVKTTRLSVCNYSKYQDARRASDEQVTSNRLASDEQVTTNNNDNNANHDNNDKQEKARERFTDFWGKYKTGNKKRAFEKWQKLSQAQITEMLEKLPAYLASTPNGQFRKNADTYLNKDAEYWNDPIRSRGNAKPNTVLEDQYANAF